VQITPVAVLAGLYRPMMAAPTIYGAWPRTKKYAAGRVVLGQAFVDCEGKPDAQKFSKKLPL
jgi:hypothetical protein